MNMQISPFITNLCAEHPWISLIVLLVIVGVIYFVIDIFVIPDESLTNNNKEQQ